MSFSEIYNSYRRLCILTVLSETPGYRLNHLIITRAVSALAAPEASADVILADLSWLKDVSLVEIEDDMKWPTIAKLTARGLDVAKGITVVPGVKRPGPR